MRKGTDGKYSSVAGSKGWRWLESSDVSKLHYENNIDMGYFRDLASEAVTTIEKFGSFEKFVNESVDMYVNAVPFMNAPEN